MRELTRNPSGPYIANLFAALKMMSIKLDRIRIKDRALVCSPRWRGTICSDRTAVTAHLQFIFPEK